METCDYKNFTRDGSVEPIRDESGEMNCGQEIPIELVVSGDDARVHWRGERQNDRRRSDICIPAWGRMKDDQPAEQIAQRMDFVVGPPRSANRLALLLPFPLETQPPAPSVPSADEVRCAIVACYSARTNPHAFSRPLINTQAGKSRDANLV